MKKKKKTNKPFWEGLKKERAGKKSGKKKTTFSGEKEEKPKERKSPERKSPERKSLKVDFNKPNPEDSVRLNRFIAQAGICSRREADQLIAEGKIKINGKVVTEMGTQVLPARDTVEYQGKPLRSETFVYILFNKPKNMITTTSDPLGRPTVLDALKTASDQRIYPVGRLDRNTTGLLLLTNDGELAKKLTHPSHKVKKLYHVRLDKDVSEEDLNRLLKGIELEDGLAKADKVDYVSGGGANEVGIQVHIGRNRIVRRMFESMGYRVVSLDRVMISHLTKKNLPRGKWRELSVKEVSFLKMI